MASGDREKFSGHLESDAKDPPDAPRPRETFRCGLSVENSYFFGVASMAWRWSRHAIERHRDNIPSMAWGRLPRVVAMARAYAIEQTQHATHPQHMDDTQARSHGQGEGAARADRRRAV